MAEVVEVKYLENYVVWLKFNDGFESKLNLRPLIGKGFSSELLDLNVFKQVSIEPGGGLSWENGFDICPNYLREIAEQNKHVA